MVRVRPPVVAGSFYPSEPAELKRVLEDCFVSNRLGPQGVKSPTAALLGGMVPHAGYIYSGPCAAHLYSALERGIQCVILLGVNHRGRGANAALSASEFWQTPLGNVSVDRALGERLRRDVDFLTDEDGPHHAEHSIEVQLPFLQSVLEDFSFLPISLSRLTLEDCSLLGQVIARLYDANRASNRKTLLLASSDLSHYLSPEETERLDGMALEKVLALDPAGLLETVEQNDISMCGVFPTVVLLFAANSLGAKRARLLKHCHSGDAVPMREVVGYASVVVEL